MSDQSVKGRRVAAGVGLTVLGFACAGGTAAAAPSKIVFVQNESRPFDPEYDLRTVFSDGSHNRRIRRGRAYDPSWSPGKGRIVFRSAPEGSPGSLATVGSRGRHERFPRGTKAAADPAWAPKGGRIAFTRFGAIFTIRPDGSHRRRLTRYSYYHDPAWSPDGKRIIYAGRRGIGVMRADGSHKRKVVARGSHPSWSPDGARIAYQREGNVWVALADGTRIRKVTGGKRGGLEPVWAPDGKRIAFTGRGGGIWVMTRDGIGAHRISARGFSPDW